MRASFPISNYEFTTVQLAYLKNHFTAPFDNKQLFNKKQRHYMRPIVSGNHVVGN